MSEAARYIVSEGSLSLPCAAQDQSITILSLRDLQATLVITREWKVSADQVDDFLERQLVKIQRDMKKFSAREPVQAELGGLPAREVAMRFENQGVKIEQKLLVCWLGDHLLAMTFSATGQLSASQLAGWQQICQGFVAGKGEE